MNIKYTSYKENSRHMEYYLFRIFFSNNPKKNMYRHLNSNDFLKLKYVRNLFNAAKI